MHLPLFIARRYLFAKKSHNVINIISAISAIGMAIGTAALVVILSVSLTLFFDRGNQYALPATISSLGNVGPAIGDLGVMGNFGAQAAGAKFMYTVDMFLGRVEIYPVLAVLMMLFNRRTK